MLTEWHCLEEQGVAFSPSNDTEGHFRMPILKIAIAVHSQIWSSCASRSVAARILSAFAEL